MNTPELLAPAGNIESFFAALENGADAVYVGYRHFNARALAANFTLEDIARLKEYAHNHGLNAALREEEIEEIVDTLSGLSQVEPDGLIIQDGAIARLCQLHFPNLSLHASTLMTVHNSAGVEQLQSMGFQRVVLARELTIEELASIATSTTLELEIFIHGALCYSYSGLCLASSFYGGRSSVRGRCVQPCRRLYRSGRHQGYFFSPNDLSAIDLIPRLRQLRLAAFKIEGRMKLTLQRLSVPIDSYWILHQVMKPRRLPKPDAYSKRHTAENLPKDFSRPIAWARSLRPIVVVPVVVLLPRWNGCVTTAWG